MHHKHSPTLLTSPYILGLLQAPQTLTMFTDYRVSAVNIFGLLHAPQTLTHVTDYRVSAANISGLLHAPKNTHQLYRLQG